MSRRSRWYLPGPPHPGRSLIKSRLFGEITFYLPLENDGAVYPVNVNPGLHRGSAGPTAAATALAAVLPLSRTGRSESRHAHDSGC